jgi:hypothetical protein
MFAVEYVFTFGGVAGKFNGGFNGFSAGITEKQFIQVVRDSGQYFFCLQATQ